jgi:hypothetical protein
MFPLELYLIRHRHSRIAGDSARQTYYTGDTSTGLSTYELEKLIEVRQWETGEAMRRRLLLSARRWIMEQSIGRDAGAELSRHAGGRV